MKIIRTILLYLVFGMTLVTLIPFLIPFIITYLFNLEKSRIRLMYAIEHIWSAILVRTTGTTVTVIGKENLPVQNTICFVSNHQGAFDIPIIMGYIPKNIGFIAKKELKLIPIMSTFMKALPCIFINRANRRESVKVIQQGAEQIRNGHPIVIFPEGTRSRSGRMGPFKSGSLKLAVRSKALIVPLTVNGSYNIREANHGMIKPAKVTLTIHPSIDASQFTGDDTKDLAEKLWDIINKPLQN